MTEIEFKISRSGTVLEFRGRKEDDLFISSDEILGKNINQIVPADLADSLMHFTEKAMKNRSRQTFNYELLVITQENCYEARFVDCGDEKMLIILRNVSEQKEYTEKQIRYLSYHDTLTRLPNRYLFRDRLEQAIANAVRKKRLLAIVLLDMDNFKNINDTIGHTAGDHLLQGFSERLSRCVRQTDSISRMPSEKEDSFVARLGGDEFIILLSEIDNIQDPARICNRMLEMLSEPFTLGPHEVFVSVSIGIAVYPYDGEDIDTLVKNADVAMYQAKNRGRNNYQYYSESLNVFSLERLTVENKLRRALYHNEFMLFYQPQIDISTGDLIGVEALIRWLQPDLILVKPGEFIPIAEKAGLIIPIGEWVLHTACSQGVAWQKAGVTMRITVNVSSIQFAQEDFLERVSWILNETGLAPGFLQLELTEGTIMTHSDDSVKKLHSLRDMGIQISLDDFGTGYSSLNYLKRFPLSTLKIDKSFIQDLAKNSDDQSITKTIIDIASNFHLNVIAEGVETREQLYLLQEYGCRAVQGHLICPPVNAISLAQFAKEYKNLSALQGLIRRKQKKTVR